MQRYAAAHRGLEGTTTDPKTLTYGGGLEGAGVTSSKPKVYLVFWGTQWGTQGQGSHGNLTFSMDRLHGAPYIQKLMQGLGTGSEHWSGTMTQYCDGAGVKPGTTSCPSGSAHVAYPTGGVLAGVWYDHSAAEPKAASGHQLAVEAVRAAKHFGNTKSADNRYTQYVILSAPGLNPDNYENQGFCAWHDYTEDKTLDGGGAAPSPYGDLAFTNMPYVMDVGLNCGASFVNIPGPLDGYSIVEGHEYAETITDQYPLFGWANRHNNSFFDEEVGDECAWISSGPGRSADVTTGQGRFAMQSIWSNDDNRCDISHRTVS
jgi:serine protease